MTEREFSNVLQAVKPVPLDNPPNPWSTTEVEYLEEIPRVKLEVYEDQTRQIVSKNDSPDIGFTYSVNPYRGCMHACAYCYARPAQLPLQAERVLHRLRETRGGKLYDSRFGTRGRGEGLYAQSIEALFDVTARKLGFRTEWSDPAPTTFRRPKALSAQLSLL